jgi:hypothetical protein
MPYNGWVNTKKVEQSKILVKINNPKCLDEFAVFI